jgi:hypothetical protein
MTFIEIQIAATVALLLGNMYFVVRNRFGRTN